MQQRGRIELIMGCMFAGKSTELLRRCNKHEITGKKVLRIKFSADVRYGNEYDIATHGGIKGKAISATCLSDLGDSWRKFDVIGVDEGQFFSDIIEFAEMAANEQKIVIVASLQGTFLRGPFQNIVNLIPRCEKIKKLSAICKLCKQNASFTFRTATKEVTSMIGGADMYMPLCRACHGRETQFNINDAFDGNPELIDVKHEKKNAKTSNNSSPTTEITNETSNSSDNGNTNESPAAKSFSSDCGEESGNSLTGEGITLRSKPSCHIASAGPAEAQEV